MCHYNVNSKLRNFALIPKGAFLIPLHHGEEHKHDFSLHGITRNINKSTMFARRTTPGHRFTIFNDFQFFVVRKSVTTVMWCFDQQQIQTNCNEAERIAILACV